jgi:hypothetical protein
MLRKLPIWILLTLSWSITANSKTNQIIPETHAGQLESLLDDENRSTLDEDGFHLIIDTVLANYEDEMLDWGDINNKFIKKYCRSKRVGASCSRKGKEGNTSIYLTVYGGTAKHEMITPAAFTLIVCHEMGHLYGGKPFLYEKARLSAEGVADYFAVNSCLKDMISQLPDILQANDFKDPEITRLCKGDQTCRIQLEAAVSSMNVTADTLAKKVPSLSTPDTTVVETTELDYPSTLQCRLDTYLAAAKGSPYPKCWFKD